MHVKRGLRYLIWLSVFLLVSLSPLSLALQACNRLVSDTHGHVNKQANFLKQLHSKIIMALNELKRNIGDLF